MPSINLVISDSDCGSRKDAFQFYFGVNNIFKQLPPLGTTATGSGTAIFDYRGRNFFAGFRARY